MLPGALLEAATDDKHRGCASRSIRNHFDLMRALSRPKRTIGLVNEVAVRITSFTPDISRAVTLWSLDADRNIQQHSLTL